MPVFVNLVLSFQIPEANLHCTPYLNYSKKLLLLTKHIFPVYVVAFATGCLCACAPENINMLAFEYKHICLFISPQIPTPEKKKGKFSGLLTV